MQIHRLNAAQVAAALKAMS